VGKHPEIRELREMKVVKLKADKVRQLRLSISGKLLGEVQVVDVSASLVGHNDQALLTNCDPGPFVSRETWGRELQFCFTFVVAGGGQWVEGQSRCCSVTRAFSCDKR